MVRAQCLLAREQAEPDTPDSLPDSLPMDTLGGTEVTEQAGGRGAGWGSEKKEPRALSLSAGSKRGALITVSPHPCPLATGGAACPQNVSRRMGVVEGAASKQPPRDLRTFVPTDVTLERWTSACTDAISVAGQALGAGEHEGCPSRTPRRTCPSQPVHRGAGPRADPRRSPSPRFTVSCLLPVLCAHPGVFLALRSVEALGPQDQERLPRGLLLAGLVHPPQQAAHGRAETVSIARPPRLSLQGDG